LENPVEEITGGITAFILSGAIYSQEILTDSINSLFVLLNTGLAVIVSHYLKKRLNKNDADEKREK